ncbi:hypothetical protein M513_10503 [Trichuris suis]|uniref:Uncharacterized protein n=1 Tax=Trichuris suis TaxID=68888 RepID=A0A085LUK2_9BILA|nr:hypothetical protein M513_10503 [Trichuris suis]
MRSNKKFTRVFNVVRTLPLLGVKYAKFKELYALCIRVNNDKDVTCVHKRPALSVTRLGVPCWTGNQPCHRKALRSYEPVT